MFLERLCELRNRLTEIPPPHHENKEVSWYLEICQGGDFYVWTKNNSHLIIPYRGRGNNPPPLLLVDNISFVLGIPAPDDKKLTLEDAEKRHRDFINLIQEFHDSLEEDSRKDVQSILKFMEGEGIQKALQELPALKKQHLICFLVGGKKAHEIPGASEFWAKKRDLEISEASEWKTQCPLCREIKGIPEITSMTFPLGGERTKIVSANCNSFESYGLKGSRNAPICEPCSRKYGEALQFLLSKENHRFTIGNSTYLFWTREKTDFEPLSVLKSPQPEDVANLFRNPFQGFGGESVNPKDFYFVALSPNKTRLIIRDYTESSLDNVVESLKKWFQKQTLYTASENPKKYHGVYALASSLVPNKNQKTPDWNKLPPQVIPILLRGALFSAPLPKWFLSLAIQRVCVETKHRLTRPRIALIKMVLTDNLTEGSVTESLDENNKGPGYLCGRLFAVLESLQWYALGDLNSSITDRFYSSASTTPMLVFPSLIQKAQPHLKKVNKKIFVVIDKQITEILSHVQEFPRVFNLQDQAFFSLGYYHQREKNFRGKDKTSGTE